MLTGSGPRGVLCFITAFGIPMSEMIDEAARRAEGPLGRTHSGADRMRILKQTIFINTQELNLVASQGGHSRCQGRV